MRSCVYQHHPTFCKSTFRPLPFLLVGKCVSRVLVSSLVTSQLARLKLLRDDCVFSDRVFTNWTENRRLEKVLLLATCLNSGKAQW